jgi:hypothetical protein
MERGCIDGIVDASGDTTKPRISPSHQLKHTGDRRAGSPHSSGRRASVAEAKFACIWTRNLAVAERLQSTEGRAGSDRRTGDRRKSPSAGETCQCRVPYMDVPMSRSARMRGSDEAKFACIWTRKSAVAKRLEMTEGRCRERPPHRRPQEGPIRRGDVPMSWSARDRGKSPFVGGATPTDRYSTKGGLR